jgi:hypothetical protein
VNGKSLTGTDQAGAKETIDLAAAQRLLAAIERAIADGKTSLRSLAQAVRLEVAIAVAERACDQSMNAAGGDPLFRLRLRRWAMAEGDLAALVPIREPHLCVLELDYDVSEYRSARTAADFPRTASPRASAIVVFGRSGDERRDPLLVDTSTARILKLCDGTRTVAQIASQSGRRSTGSAAKDELEWIENLFLCGLVRLQHGDTDASIRSKWEINTV